MESQRDRVSVRQAVQAAMTYIKSLYAGEKIQNLLLEEVEFSEATHQWLITIGFSLSDAAAATTLIAPSARSQASSRRYKIVEIDGTTGQPVSMKIRAV